MSDLVVKQHIENKVKALEAKRNFIKQNLPHLYGSKFYQWQRNFFDAKQQFCFLTASNQCGKANSVDEQCATPTGWVRFGDLKVGDFVFGSDGTPTKVVAIPFEGEREFYKVTFTDLSTIEASGDHLWKCKTSEERFRKTAKNYGEWVVRSTDELIESGRYAPYASRPYNKACIPFTEPVHYPEKDVLDPYLLGLILGDGCITDNTVTVCKPDKEIQDYIVSFGGKRRACKKTTSLPIAYANKLREYNLMGTYSHTKFIPEIYLHASYTQRLALLQGLMDTDGYIGGRGHVEYSTASPRLAAGVRELVASLGGYTWTTIKKTHYTKNGVKHPCKDSHRMVVKMIENPFRLTRKAKKFYQIRYKHERVIEKIEPIGVKKCRCITVDNEDHTYLIGKDYIVTHNSTIQIRRMIHWATSPNLWPRLWPKSPHPRVFWYLYPSDEMAISEWLNKWLPEFMPRNEMKDHPQFGWTVDATSREIRSITFNTGVTIQFKSYGQKSSNLQGTTVHAIGFDEELPFEHYNELTNRLNATDGYLSGVFTPTLNQEFWYKVMEGKGDNELLKEAVKFQVSLYDCLHYEDGTPSTVWTLEKIEKVKSRCGSPTEVQRRVYGKFVTEEGRKFPSFDTTVHFVKPFQLRSDVLDYAAVDIGSGGAKSHPASITFVAVRPDYKEGWVYKGWRGDGVDTTSADILDKYRELRDKDNIIMAVFDGAAKDFGTIAGRLGEPFTPANKKVGDGVDLINALFKNNMLHIFDEPELTKLGGELMLLMHGQNKSTAKDDFVDSLRYALMAIPWDFSDVSKNMLVKEDTDRANRPWTEAELAEMHLKDRRGELNDPRKEGSWQEFDADIDYWNGLYGN